MFGRAPKAEKAFSFPIRRISDRIEKLLQRPRSLNCLWPAASLPAAEESPVNIERRGAAFGLLMLYGETESLGCTPSEMSGVPLYNMSAL